MVNKPNLVQISKNYCTVNEKIVKKLENMRSGFGIMKKLIPDPGSATLTTMKLLKAVLRIRIRIRIHRIYVFLALPDPDPDPYPLVRGMDPDPDPALHANPDPSIM